MSELIMTSPISDESQENKMIALALKQAERQMADGTASSQIVTHFLRLASSRNKVELEKLRLENQLLEEKIQAEQSGAYTAQMVEDVLAALRSYSYTPPGDSNVDIY